MANKNKTYTLSFDVKNGDEVEKVQIEIGKTAKSVGELEHQIETLTAAIKKAEFGTPEFAKLTKELGNAKTKLVNFEESIADISKGEKVEGLFKIGSAIAGGFAIAEAASSAFGEQLGLNQEQIAKTQAKFQILLVTLESLQLVQEALGKENKFLTQILARNATATNVQTAATGKATIAQKAFNLVARANPIGLIVTAIFLIIAGFYAFSKASDSTKTKVKDFFKTLLLLNPFGLLYKGLEALYKGFAPFKKFIDGTVKLITDVFITVKDFIAETTGLFDTQAKALEKKKAAQFEQELLRQKLIKESIQKTFEQESEITRRQAKLRNASASEQLALEQKIAQEALKRFNKENEQLLKSKAANDFLTKKLGFEVVSNETINDLTIKRLDLELQVSEIRKQGTEQAKANIEALLAKIIEAGEKEQLQAKLANEDEIQLARLKKKNIQEQLDLLRKFYKEDSIQILKLKDQQVQANIEHKNAVLQKNQELADATLADFKLFGASDLKLLETRKQSLTDLLNFTKLNFGESSKEARKYAEELIALDKEITSKLFTKIDVEIAPVRDLDAERAAKEEQARKDRIEKEKEAVDAVLKVYDAIGEAITSQIDERIAESQEKIAQLDEQASDSVARSEALTATLDEARGARRLDAIRQIEAERQKQKQLADEKLKQEQKIQVEEKKKQRLLATTNAINQTTAAINVIVANSEALKGVFSQAKTTFPGNIIAIGATIAAIIAAASAIKSIKFAKGGHTGTGHGSPDETGYKPAGIVHEHEYVVPKRILETSQGSDLVGKLEYMRKGFAGGGFTSDVVPNFSGISSSIDTSQMLMLQKLDELKATNIALANRKTVVSVEAIDKVQTEVNKIKVNATT